MRISWAFPPDRRVAILSWAGIFLNIFQIFRPSGAGILEKSTQNFSGPWISGRSREVQNFRRLCGGQKMSCGPRIRKSESGAGPRNIIYKKVARGPNFGSRPKILIFLAASGPSVPFFDFFYKIFSGIRSLFALGRKCSVNCIESSEMKNTKNSLFGLFLGWQSADVSGS